VLYIFINLLDVSAMVISYMVYDFI